MALDLFPGDTAITGDQLGVEIEAYVRIEPVNVVATSGAAVSIPDPATNATSSDVTLTANCTFTLPTAARGKSFVVLIRQDATGSRAPTFTGAKWPLGTVPAWSTGVGKVDLVSFVCIDGTNWMGSALLDLR